MNPHKTFQEKKFLSKSKYSTWMAIHLFSRILTFTDITFILYQPLITRGKPLNTEVIYMLTNCLTH